MARKTANKYILEIQAEYSGESSIKKLQSDLKALEQVQNYQQSIAQWQSLNKQFVDAKNQVRELRAVMRQPGNAGMAAGYQDAVKAQRELQRALATARARMVDAGAALQQYGISASNAAAQVQRLQAAAQRAGQAAAARNILGIIKPMDITTQIRQVQAAYARLKASGELSLQGQTQAWTRMNQRIRALREQTNGWGAHLGAIKNEWVKLLGVVSSLSIVGRGIREYAQFSDAMLRVQAIAGATANEMEKLNAQAQQLGASTRFTALDAANAMQQLAAAGQTVSQVQASMQAVMDVAAIAQMDVGLAADQVTNIMAQFDIQAEQSARVADVLASGFTGAATTMDQLAQAMSYSAPVAHALGYSIEETTSILMALANSGYKADRAGTALRGGLTRLIKPPKMARDALEKYGIQIRDTEGQMRHFADIMDDIKAAGVTTEDQIRIFGAQAGPGMIALVSKGGDALRQYQKRVEESGGAARKMADEMESGIGGAMRRLSAAVSAIVIAFGDQFAPGISLAADALASLAGSIAGMPAWGKYILVATAGLLSFGLAAKSARVLLEALVLMGASSITKLAGAVASLRGGFVALSATMAANPIGAGIVAALTVATAAYQLFGESALEFSKKHAEAAKKIGDNLQAGREELDELKSLQKTLLDASKSAEEHAQAEERLAQILPDANLRLDEQGRLLATLKDESSENAKILADYIDLKSQEVRLDTAMQLEEQAKAYYEAKNAVREYADNLREWYGIGAETQDWANKFWLTLNRFTGTYDKNIAKGTEYKKNLAEQKQAFEQLLQSLARSGASRGQVAEMLSGIHLDSGMQERVLADYEKMLERTKGSAAKANQAMSVDAIKKAQEEQKAREAALDAAAEKYKEYAATVKSIQDDLANREKSLAAELREMGRGGMSDADAWKDQKREAEEYAAAARAAAETARQAMAGGDSVTAMAKWKEAVDLADQAKQAYKGLNKEVRDGDQVVVSRADALKTAMAGVKEAGQLGIDIMKEQEQATKNTMETMEREHGIEAMISKMDEAARATLNTWKDISEAMKNVPLPGAQMAADLAEAADEMGDDFEYAFDKSQQAGVQAAKAVKTAFDDATKARTVKIYTQTIEKHALGGLIGAVRMARGGKLSGFGGGDRISALLEAGEFVVRKEAVAKFGIPFFDAFNRLRLPDLSALLPVVPVPALSAGGAGSRMTLELKLPGGDSVNASVSGDDAERLKRWNRRVSHLGGRR